MALSVLRLWLPGLGALQPGWLLILSPEPEKMQGARFCQQFNLLPGRDTWIDMADHRIEAKY